MSHLLSVTQSDPSNRADGCPWFTDNFWALVVGDENSGGASLRLSVFQLQSFYASWLL